MRAEFGCATSCTEIMPHAICGERREQSVNAIKGLDT
jgi:hypothetical protein